MTKEGLSEKDELIFDTRRDAERMWPEEHRNVSGFRLEVFARWWVERFGDKYRQDGYFLEWADRFSRGTEWYNMDGQSTKAYLKILATPWRGTNRCIQSDEMAAVLL